MIEITEPESKTLEAYIKTRSIDKTMTQTKRSRDTVHRHLARLVKLGILFKEGRKKFHPTGMRYVVRPKQEHAPNDDEKGRIIQIRIESDSVPKNIPEEIRNYIKGHYGLMPRSRLAKRVGMSKVDLNNMIIALGLSKERTHQNGKSA